MKGRVGQGAFVEHFFPIRTPGRLAGSEADTFGACAAAEYPHDLKRFPRRLLCLRFGLHRRTQGFLQRVELRQHTVFQGGHVVERRPLGGRRANRGVRQRMQYFEQVHRVRRSPRGAPPATGSPGPAGGSSWSERIVSESLPSRPPSTRRSSLPRRDFEGRGDDPAALDLFLFAVGGRPADTPGRAVDRDHARVLDDGAGKHRSRCLPAEGGGGHRSRRFPGRAGFRASPAGGGQLGGQDHVHPVARVDQARLARRRAHLDRHRARSGLEHGSEKPPLSRPHHGPPGERIPAAIASRTA